MSDANKILTVSYGTFSCTLEGFDDPFGTMRGIAEYFRDLAAEDRYFGAEPPTPDVEMLQAIARRNMQGRVEARIGDSGVALRATDGVEDAELTTPATGADGRAPDTSETPAAEAAPDVAAAPATETPDAEASEKPSEPKAVAVSPTAPLAFDDEYLMADEPEDAFQVDLNAPAVSDRPPESIAEKLRRIRAVVSRNIEPEPADSAASDDVRSDEVSAFAGPAGKRDRALSETIRSISADIAEDDEDTPLEGGSLFAEADESEDSIADETPDEDIRADDAFDGETGNDHETGTADEASSFEDTREDAEPKVEDSSDQLIAGVMAASASHSDENGAPPPDTDMPDAGAADVTEAEDVEDDSETAADEVSTAVDTASDGADDRDRGGDLPLAPLSDEKSVGRLLKETDQKFADGDGIRRRRVISQMRAAVAATKAERVFSKLVSPDEQARMQQTPYRRDLDVALPEAPTRAEADATPEPDTTERDASAPESAPAPKPTPLVLVSSQRVDSIPAPVTAPEPDPDPDPNAFKVTEGDSFATFAEKMGAEELPDLLEAAAAYSAFVEGQPHFSRPEIMKRVARVDPALSLSREAGLRSFGMLLRQGKIHKLQRGQFAISEDTRFNPAQRIAGE